MFTIRRKFCRLHGWAPHRTLKGLADFWTGEIPHYKVCLRCHPPAEFSKTASIKAFFRGFKLHDSTTAKQFLKERP